LIGLGNREGKPGEGTSFSVAFDPGACATEASTGQRSITKEFNLPPLSITNPDGIKVRIFVDSGSGSFHVFANGVLAAQIGKCRAESDIHKGVFDMVTFNGGKSAFSGLWIGPWNGEFPTPENLAVPSAMLRSGDLIPAAPSMFKDGKFHFETKELGRLEFPADRAQWLTFAGAPDTAQAQALMRTGDGQAIHCEEFHIEGGEVVARSAALGEIRMPLKNLKELIRKPSPPVAPPSVSLKTLSSKPPTGPQMAIPPDAI
jgi:hypothetical protein